MCLILFAWQAHPRYRLVLAANRDEFHARPTRAAEFWTPQRQLLAGRDLQAGGTWLGVTRTGRFAAVTNYREPLEPELPLERSRGELVTEYLVGRDTPLAHAESLLARGDAFRGFNLLLGDAGGLAYVSNRFERVLEPAAGSHGLSNHLLDTDWPKVRCGRAKLDGLLRRDHIEAEALLEMLTERNLVPGDMPEDADDSEIRRHLMNHYFIVSPTYGTRSSTVLLIGRDGNIEFVERRFAPDGTETGTSRFVLRENDRRSARN
jgi:uncharacterized protein with NRDE domain